LSPLIAILTHHLDRAGYLPGASEALRAAFSCGRDGIQSRSRLPLTPDVTLVFFAKKIEFLIAADVANRLNAFLGEWLPAIAEAA
jgi:hypothetical protein